MPGRSPRAGLGPGGWRRGNPFHMAPASAKATDVPWSKTAEFGSMTLVFVSAVLIYWNTFDANFAYDDSRAIKTNQDLLPTTPLSALLVNDFWGTPLTHSGSHKSYRPICVLSFRINYIIGGLDPRGYHVANVLLHAMVTLTFTRLAAMVFCQQTLPTVVAGLLFAVHPIHTEAVAGIVGRADVGACFFFLLGLIFYIKYCQNRDLEPHGRAIRWLYLYASLIFSACSMLTKEHGVTVLGVCFVYDLFIHSKISMKEISVAPFDKRFSGLREGFIHLGGTAITLLGMRLHLMGSGIPDFAPADNPAADSDSFITRILTFLYLPAFNFWLLIYPRWLSFDWSMEAIPLLSTFSDARNICSLIFYGVLFITLWWLNKTIEKRRISYNAACYLAGSSGKHGCSCNSYSKRFAIAIQSNNNNHRSNKKCNTNGQCSYSNGPRSSNGNGNQCPHQVAGCSRNGYVPFARKDDVAALWKLPFPGSSVWAPFACTADVITLSMVLLIFPFIPATNFFFYVGFVVAERILYIPSMGFCLLVALGMDQLYQRQPSSIRKRVLLTAFFLAMAVLSARTLTRNTDWLTEENLYRSGIDVNPPKAYGNLANILSGQGKKPEAEWAYKKALSYRANMADVRYNLGILLQEQGRYEEALSSYKLAIQFRPRLAMAHLNLGLVLTILGKKEEAAQAYRNCAELDSSGLKDPKMHETTRISALFNLGRLFADEGRYQDAMEIYYEAVHKMPPYYQPQSLYNMMGEAFFKMGQFDEAEQWYQEALRVKPDHIPAHLTYAKLLSRWNRTKESEQRFLKAKKLAPNDSSVYQHYGQYLSECDRHTEAAEVYIKAAELASDEYEIVFNAANTLRQAGRNEEAETYYQKAVKLKPDEGTSHMNLGAMLHVNGKLKEAEASYLEAMRLRPDDPITVTNLQKLRNLMAQKERLRALREK